MKFGSQYFFLVALFHFTCSTWLPCFTSLAAQYISENVLKFFTVRQFQSIASFEICKIYEPLFSKVRFSVFTYGFFRNLYDVTFVFGQLKLSLPQHGIVLTFP